MSGSERSSTNADGLGGWISPSLFDVRLQSIVGGFLGGVVLAVANGVSRTMLTVRDGILGLLGGVGNFREEVIRQLLNIPATVIDAAFAAARGDLGQVGVFAFAVATAVTLASIWVIAQEVEVLG